MGSDQQRTPAQREMMAAQLKETTMEPRRRTLLKGQSGHADRKSADKSVKRPMGNKPELRFEFIRERAEFADEAVLDVELFLASAPTC